MRLVISWAGRLLCSLTLDHFMEQDKKRDIFSVVYIYSKWEPDDQTEIKDIWINIWEGVLND